MALHPAHGLVFRAGELGLSLGDPLRFYSILRNSFDHSPYLLQSLYSDPPAHWKDLSYQSLGRYFDPSNPDLLNEMLLLEARTKLPNDFLLTEDRVSMAHALEVRVPLLDREIVEFAAGLPSSMVYSPRTKKKLLKDAAEEWIPREMLDKKKWGFSFNPVLLFEKQLKPLAQEILTPRKLADLQVFNPKWVRQVLESPVSPRMRWHYFNLWVMIGFALWHDRFIVGRSSR